MKIRWLGHAAFLIEGSKKVLIDPFISGNPVAPVKPEDLEVDVILVTHGHSDHLGDAVEIATRCDAPIVCIYELSVFLSDKGVGTIGMNIGGTLKLDDNVKITMVKAVHSADVVGKNIISAGVPVGFIINMDGISIYHAGDTDVFIDMKLIGELYKPKIALLPIGDLYTMGIPGALKAIELIRPEIVIPMHYNTFPAIKQNPEEFKAKAEKMGVKVVILNPGESFEI
ncbi:MAG TPA: metal-dependent hydrolase [Archaeoglobus profundus]|nr:metal-dependent hydrolase [Archaeoglobus profundus]